MQNDEIPVLRWDPNFKVDLPPEHVPDFVEVGDGRVIDEAMLVWIVDALLEAHPNGAELNAVLDRSPGLDLGPGPDKLVRVWLAATGDPVGLFDRRWLHVA